jgi:hypothetical protein
MLHGLIPVNEMFKEEGLLAFIKDDSGWGKSALALLFLCSALMNDKVLYALR